MVAFSVIKSPAISAIVHLRCIFALRLFTRSSYAFPSLTSSPHRRRSLTLIRGFSTFGVAGASSHERYPNDFFLADEGVSWASLGISDKLSASLSAIGFTRASLVQAACIPHVLSEVDVVIAAETGSGKTHGYLIPIIDKLCGTKPHKISLVLCPNVMLCEQVVDMCKCLQDVDGRSLVTITAVCGRQGWPVVEPDIIVSTPAALLNFLYAFNAEKKRTQFLHGVKHVVFDEADLLLCGSFQNQVIRLINMLRFEEKSLSSLFESQNKISVELNSESRRVDDDENSVCHENHSQDIASACREKSHRKASKVYTRSKQYIFVAATLPVNGKRTAGGILKKMFPHATWVSGRYLHHHNPRLQHRWIEVTADTQVEALIEAVKHGFKCHTKFLPSNGGEARTMVFVNTMDAVESVANILLRVGIKCFTYHRDKDLEVQMKNLTEFKEQRGVLVCTDAAARGLDIPNISHVIQAEFANSAVDFLHRVGRTGRAGRTGLVTSLYTECKKDLVEAVCGAVSVAKPMEEVFSRRRSFRKKLKKGVIGLKNGASTADRVLA